VKEIECEGNPGVSHVLCEIERVGRAGLHVLVYESVSMEAFARNVKRNHQNNKS